MIEHYETITKKTFTKNIRAIMKKQQITRPALIQKTMLGKKRLHEIFEKSDTPSFPEAMLIADAIVELTNHTYTITEVIGVNNYKLEGIHNESNPH